jgi:hypothetical protein
VALGDVNGDGHLDAVFANWGQPNRECLGNGTGGFTCTNVSGDALITTDVALGDLAVSNPKTHVQEVWEKSN